MPLLRINREPSDRDLRWFAAASAGAGGALGLAGRGAGFALAGGVLAAVGLMAPGLLRRPFVLVSYATYPVGWVVSHVVIAALYYGAITPLGCLLRALGRDPLQRPFDRGAPSYWRTRGPSPQPESYFRQY